MKQASDRPNRYLKRREAERFWQFQFERDPIKETRTFYDKDYGSKESALEAARAHRDEFFRTAVDIGVLDSDGTFYIRPLPIQLKPTLRSKSGIVGVSRVVSSRRTRGSVERVWVANFKNENDENEQKSFSIDLLGEKGALLAAIRFRRQYVAQVLEQVNFAPHKTQIQAHLEELDFLCEYIETLVEGDSELFYLLSTLNNPGLSPTEKHDFLSRRVGQERFRRMVLARWGEKCAITGARLFLTAGHIKPWSVSNDHERLDPNNGLALSPVYDRAFDAGLISFAEDGRIMVSSRLNTDAAALGISGREQLQGLSAENLRYLEFHRSNRFANDA
jgi:hypothetical protein